MIIGFIIWTICAVLFVAIGISNLKSDKPVGFFTFANPPTIKEDVKKYNRDVAVLWFVFAFLLELLGTPFLFFEQNSPAFLIIIPGVIVLIIFLMVAYFKIEAKYRE